MKKTTGLIIISTLLLFIIIVLAANFFSRQNEPTRAGKAGILEVYVFGIGRADAILITTQHHAVMIDTGENMHGAYLVRQLAALGIDRLDYLIITHFDSDHVGGAHTIINHLEIGQVIAPHYHRESNHVARFLAAVNNTGTDKIDLTEPLRFTLDDAHFVIDPSGLGYENYPRRDDDDFSMIVAVSHGQNHFLFAADANNHRLRTLLENDEIMGLDYVFYKMARHGRHGRRSIELIQAIQPRYAVITGFPPEEADLYAPELPADARVIAALEEAGAEIFFATTEMVHAISDGTALTVTQIE